MEQRSKCCNAEIWNCRIDEECSVCSSCNQHGARYELTTPTPPTSTVEELVGRSHSKSYFDSPTSTEVEELRKLESFYNDNDLSDEAINYITRLIQQAELRGFMKASTYLEADGVPARVQREYLRELAQLTKEDK